MPIAALAVANHDPQPLELPCFSLQGLLWETSLLDPEEGIRFRGYSIPELQVTQWLEEAVLASVHA